MTYDSSAPPIAAGRRGPEGESAARSLVRVLAVGALLGAVAGVAVLVSIQHLAPRWWAAWTGLLAVCVVAAGCVRHGVRHEHERGRAFAIVALVIAVPALIIGTWGGLVHGCPSEHAPGAADRGRCINPGPWQ